MSQARKVLSNTAFQVGGKLITAAISVVILKLITNYLDIAGYGQYAQVYDFLSYFAIISDLGLFTIAVREMVKDTARVAFVIGNILTVRIGVAILALILAIGTAFLIPDYNNSQVAIGIAIAAAGVFLTIMQGTISSVLQIYYKMQVAALSLIAGKLTTLGYIVYVVYFGFPENPLSGFPHLLAAGVLGAAVMYLITHVYVHKLTPFKPQINWKFWKDVIVTSLPYGFALILNNVYLRVNSLLIFFLRGDYEAGLYAVPMKILEILAIIGLYFMNSVLPGLTTTMKDNPARARVMIQYAFDFLVMVSVPMMVGVIVLAYPIIFLISKKEYLSRFSATENFYGSDIALKILVLAIFFQFLIGLFSFILIASHNQNKILAVNSGGVLFNLAASYFAVKAYGFRGGAVCSVLVEIVVMILMYFSAKRCFHFQLHLGRFFKILLAAAVMGLTVYFLRDMTVALFGAKAVLALVALGGFVYAAMLILTRTVTPEMVKMLLKKEVAGVDTTGPMGEV